MTPLESSLATFKMLAFLICVIAGAWGRFYTPPLPTRGGQPSARFPSPSVRLALLIAVAIGMATGCGMLGLYLILIFIGQADALHSPLVQVIWFFVLGGAGYMVGHLVTDRLLYRRERKG